MDKVLEQLWNAGIPLFLLVVAIIVVWQQWRTDMILSAKQRDDMVTAINALADRIDKLMGLKS